MEQHIDSIARFLDRFAATWEHHDGQALADAFVEEGTLINPFGQRADGRPAIAGMYNEYFAGFLAGTSTTIRLESVRPVGDDGAFVDSEQTITAADGAIVLVVHLAALLLRDGEDWKFVDSRPYASAAPAA